MSTPSSNNCNSTYCDYGSYLRSRGFDKALCQAIQTIDTPITQSQINEILADLDEKYDKTGGLINGNVDISGDLNLNCNVINDVSGITFCDGTFINQGTSFDISTNETLQIKSSKVVLVYGDAAFNNNIGLLGNLIVNNNGDDYILTFNEFTSAIQTPPKLPSINNQPVSLMRMSIFTIDTSFNISAGINQVKVLTIENTLVNQLNFDVSGEIITPSLDISGQYVELYANIEVNTIGNNTDFSFDISGIDCNFLEIIDTRSVTKKNKNYYLTFGPHVFIPSEWANCSKFNITLVNNVNNAFNVNSIKIVYKSYYL